MTGNGIVRAHGGASAGDALFIIDEPYVSDFALATLERLQAPVLKTGFSSALGGRRLNLVEGIDASQRIYTNSENSIDLVLKSIPDSGVSSFVRPCKDKYEFRKRLRPVYPDFRFRRIALAELDSANDLPDRFIIKPVVGFLSMGVHKVESRDAWESTKAAIKAEIRGFGRNFPESVLSSADFIVEEIVEGEEFAIDAYFDGGGEPVILNVFRHPFAGKDDVSDRLYMTSREIVGENLEVFAATLRSISREFGFRDFPAHIEVIKDPDGRVVPVEVNPMRFAGWCTTDLAYFAYGINVYECFQTGRKPDWREILKGGKDEMYYFAMAETPAGLDTRSVSFDHESFRRSFSRILDYRVIDHRRKPLFAIVFGATDSRDEISAILNLRTADFCLK